MLALCFSAHFHPYYCCHDDSPEKSTRYLGIVYLGLLVWILKRKLRSKIPYIVVASVSVVLIATYVASRTIGVPMVGVEYYVGKLDMAAKVLQAIIIGISVYLIFTVHKNMIKESIR
jgi:hypothetical protein